MTWYFCERPLLTPVPYTLFASGNWTDQRRSWPGQGETLDSDRPWRDGSRPQAAGRGPLPCGSDEEWAGGFTYENAHPGSSCCPGEGADFPPGGEKQGGVSRILTRSPGGEVQGGLSHLRLGPGATKLLGGEVEGGYAARGLILPPVPGGETQGGIALDFFPQKGGEFQGGESRVQLPQLGGEQEGGTSRYSLPILGGEQEGGSSRYRLPQTGGEIEGGTSFFYVSSPMCGNCPGVIYNTNITLVISGGTGSPNLNGSYPLSFATGTGWQWFGTLCGKANSFIKVLCPQETGAWTLTLRCGSGGTIKTVLSTPVGCHPSSVPWPSWFPPAGCCGTGPYAAVTNVF